MTHFGELAASADLQSDNAIWPTGVVILWPGTGVPTGFLPCDGSTQAAATYPALDAMIGNGPGYGNPGYHAYNAGASPGSGLFRLPDFRDAVPLGLSTPSSVQARTGANGAKLGTGLAHAHGGGSFYMANHQHACGSLSIGSHVHGQNWILNDHQHLAGASQPWAHGGTVYNRFIYWSSYMYGRGYCSGNTDGVDGWFGGSTGYMYDSNDEVTGNSGTADPPMLAMAFVVKT